MVNTFIQCEKPRMGKVAVNFLLTCLTLFIAGCSVTDGGGSGGGSSQSVPESSQNLPDLYIDTINWRIHDRKMDVVVRVRNIATDNCPAGFTVSVSDLSGITRTHRFDSVLLGGGLAYTANLLFPIGVGITSDTITARCDSLGVISEMNEGNNETIERCTFPAVKTAVD